MENRVKILIADGNDEFCSHLKKLLEETSGYDVVGIAADGERMPCQSRRSRWFCPAL